MKNLKKLSLAFLFLAQVSFGYIDSIGVHGGYRSFSRHSGFVNYLNFGRLAIYLGDTVRFFNDYSTNYTNVGDNLHTITRAFVPVGGQNFDADFDSRDRNLTIDLVPSDTGTYTIYCIYHTNTSLGHTMSTGFGVIYRPTSICGNRLINGTTCTGYSQNFTFVGIAQNCQCATTTSPPTTNTGCSNGLVENSTCSGVGICTSCAGIVQSCMCIASTTGIKSKPKIEENGGVLYPNPADEYITVPLRQGLKYNIYIYDKNGKEVIYERVEYLSDVKIDISKLKNGNFIVQLKYCACSTPKEGCTGANKTLNFMKK